MYQLIYALKTIVYDGKDEGSQFKWLSYAYNFFTIDYAMSSEITIKYCYKMDFGNPGFNGLWWLLSWGPSWPFLIFIIFFMQTQVLSLAAPAITFALCITTCCAMLLACQEIFSIAFSTTQRVFTGQHIRTKPRQKQDPDRKYTYLYKAGKVRSPHIAGILLKIKLSKVIKLVA